MQIPTFQETARLLTRALSHVRAASHRSTIRQRNRTRQRPGVQRLSASDRHIHRVYAVEGTLQRV